MKPIIEKRLFWLIAEQALTLPKTPWRLLSLPQKMGADGVELDVHFTSDGEVVVCHDEKIDRTSNGQGLITSYTLSELKSMDFGYHFYDGERKGVKLPTLDEVYGLLATLDMIVNVQIKSADPDIAKACDNIAKRHEMDKKVIYSSFNHFQIQKAKEVIGDAFIAPLYSFNMLNPWNYCVDIGTKAVHPKLTQIRLLPDYVKSCHDRGIRVHTWTANTEEDISFLLDSGVDAIITNHPDVALKLRVQNI